MKLTTILKAYQDKEGLQQIVYKIRDAGIVKEIPSGFKVKASQWNGEVIKHPDKDFINAKIKEKVGELSKTITDSVTSHKHIDIKKLNKPVIPASKSFIAYIKARIESYKQNDQETWASRLNVITCELESLFTDLEFAEITVDHVRKYRASLKVSPNTIHKRIKTCRQLFDNAVNEGLYYGPNPFNKITINKVPTKKEKLTFEEVKDIEDLELSGNVDLARDMFLFSYYCKGVRFENVLFLHRNDIKQGRIHIKTNKGKKHLSIKIHPKLQAILDKYGKGFVFGLVDHYPKDSKEKKNMIGSNNAIVNLNLKIVQGLAKIPTTLSMHLARHSLAFHLKQQGTPTSYITDILGQSSVAITEIYLKSLDDEFLDKEMDKIYKSQG